MIRQFIKFLRQTRNISSAIIFFAAVGCGKIWYSANSILAPTQIKKRVFVTSTTSNGNLGGIAGADAKCAAQATAAGLGGTFKAFISTGAIDAISRISDVSPWYLVDRSAVVFPTFASLTDGTGPLVAITTELRGVATFAYTGANSSGLATADTCLDWTLGGVVNGRTGNPNSVASGTWIFAGLPLCGFVAALYCFEQ
jgi:hypothetical protein